MGVPPEISAKRPSDKASEPWELKEFILAKYIQDPKEIDEILAANTVCRIALVDTTGEIRRVKATVEGTPSRFAKKYLPMPYVIPMGYAYKNEGDSFKHKKIYLHSRKTECEGLKTRLIEEHASVCFETTQIEGLKHPDDPEKPCHFGQSYRSVIGFGTVSILESNKENQAERAEALDAIMAQNGIRNPLGKVWDYSEYIDELVIFKITFRQPLTGKADPPIGAKRLDPGFPFS